ncbi:recombination protein NinB [Alcaligenes sp. 1735tsa3]|uniref:recombination protein NinB n=1 Tax=Alcaligenes sp. 1735tsa3 TaxID=2953809 RepID=UPI0020A78AB5|nr:recombination protein NinB [Alcaligenes sp. 1735tsa3]USY26692.1 recombination protein NinB [Alcaligenes sp. 1735tsa3]
MSGRKVFVLSHDAARKNAARYILEAEEGYHVEIRPRTRSLDQNAMMWSILADLSKQVDWMVNGVATKLEAEEWKDVLSASLNQETRMSQGIRGGIVMLGQRTSKMTVRQMSELIELALSFGTEKGVRWSPTSLGSGS